MLPQLLKNISHILVLSTTFSYLLGPVAFGASCKEASESARLTKEQGFDILRTRLKKVKDPNDLEMSFDSDLGWTQIKKDAAAELRDVLELSKKYWEVLPGSKKFKDLPDGTPIFALIYREDSYRTRTYRDKGGMIEKDTYIYRILEVEPVILRREKGEFHVERENGRVYLPSEIVAFAFRKPL